MDRQIGKNRKTARQTNKKDIQTKQTKRPQTYRLADGNTYGQTD